MARSNNAPSPKPAQSFWRIFRERHTFTHEMCALHGRNYLPGDCDCVNAVAFEVGNTGKLRRSGRDVQTWLIMNKQVHECFRILLMDARMAPPIPKTANNGFRAVAIGNFDGGHRGHAALVAAARSLAARKTPGRPLECLALTFDPHLASLFQPDQPMFRLTPGPLRNHALARIGFDGAVVVAFDRDFAALSAEAFIADILIARLAVDACDRGPGFPFWPWAAWHARMLQQAGVETWLCRRPCSACRDV